MRIALGKRSSSLNQLPSLAPGLLGEQQVADRLVGREPALGEPQQTVIGCLRPFADLEGKGKPRAEARGMGRLLTRRMRRPQR